ncbi:glycosyltransferase [Methylobacterium sp. CM6257]
MRAVREAETESLLAVHARRRREIEASGLFSSAHYLEINPDVAAGGLDPLEHYLRYGWKERRSISEDFDHAAYFAANPDLDPTTTDPLAHWVENGIRERRLLRPLSQGFSVRFIKAVLLHSELFDPEFYRLANPEISFGEVDPLEHYCTIGWRQRRRPSAEFDTNRYLASYPHVVELDVEPACYFYILGQGQGDELPPCQLRRSERHAAAERVRKSGLFDEAFYLRRCPAVRHAGIDPVLHYLVRGYELHLEPAEVTFVRNYIASFPDLRRVDCIPLLHFIDWGHAEGRFVQSDDTPVRWIQTEGALPLPDDSIWFDIIAGRAFFGRFGFTFESDGTSPYFSDAVTELATSNIKLEVDQFRPDVSIIIPVYGQLHFLLGCLDSLARQEAQCSVEVIVIDDAFPDRTESEQLLSIPWIQYHRREKNGGFIDTCNDGVAKSNGKIAILLNSDTRVAAGWLDEIFNTLQRRPKSGVVGSKLFNDDGSLQEAGGIYWQDGSAWNYGRGDDPNRPKYCFARRVDYISGASIAIWRNLWDELGGFDEIYRPAYAEDADLAFRVRAADREVWMQPFSRVIHYEGKTHGRDERSGIKAFQAQNMRRLRKRFASEFAKFRPNAERPDEEANRLVKRRMLVVDALLPMPDRDSGSFITAKMLAAFQELGFEITFVAQHSYRWSEAYAAPLQKNGIEYLYDPYIKDFAEVIAARNNFDFVLVFRHTVLSQIYDQIRSRLPKSRIIFHNVDLHYLREQREAELVGDKEGLFSSAITQTQELALIARSDCNIVHTVVEKKVIEEQLPLKNIIVFPYIADVVRNERKFDERMDIMFLGGFSHLPNQDAVRYFVNEVWPLLAGRLPENSRFLIVGADPTPEIETLAGDRVVVTGQVPELGPWFAQARVFVAPLRYGAGIKGKLIQSLSHGVPCVATPIASEGVGVEDGVHFLSGETSQELADAILRLYTDQELWRSLQTTGYEFVEERYSWRRCMDLCRLSLNVADETWLKRHAHRRKTLLRSILEDNGDVSSVR